MRLRFLLIVIWTSFSTLALSQSDLYSDSISVKFFLLDECRICQYYGPEFQQYYEDYKNDQIDFIGYFPNFSSKKENIARFKETHSIPFPLKTDYFKTQSKKFNAEVLPTVVVYDEVKKAILYAGRIDDRYHKVGQQKRVITSYDLKNALDSILADKPISVKNTQAIGCFINFADNISK